MEQKQDVSAVAEARKWTKIMYFGIGAFNALVVAGLLVFAYIKFIA